MLFFTKLGTLPITLLAFQIFARKKLDAARSTILKGFIKSKYTLLPISVEKYTSRE
jgi:hypothetical protein